MVLLVPMSMMALYRLTAVMFVLVLFVYLFMEMSMLQNIVYRGKVSVFTVLCEQYQPTLQRDPTYNEVSFNKSSLFLSFRLLL